MLYEHVRVGRRKEFDDIAFFPINSSKFFLNWSPYMLYETHECTANASKLP